MGLCSSAKRISRILPTAAEVFGMVEIRVVEPRATVISLLIAGGWKLLAACWKLEAGSWKLVLLAGSWLSSDTPLVADGRGGL